MAFKMGGWSPFNKKKKKKDPKPTKKRILSSTQWPKKEGGMLMYKQKDENPLDYEKIAQDEIKKNMLRANRAPSLLGGN